MKKVMTAVLSALLLAGVLALPAQAAETTYSDIDADAWYAWCVADATKRGLMNGTGGGTFSPDGDLTRAMLVTVLWRLAGEPAAEDPAEFTDVPDGQWYSDAVAWASGFNVVEGYGGGVFGPADPVTREQMAVIFYRWAEGKKYDVGFAANAALLKEESSVTRFVETETPEGYYDSAMVPIGAPVSGWAEDAVQWSAEHDFLVRREVRGQGPMGGSIYRYCVWENASRAEVAVFLSRFCRDYVDEAGGEKTTVLLHPDQDLVPLGGYHWDILSMELPETWMGSCSISYMSNYQWKPAEFGMIFWDLTNHEPWSSQGHLFALELIDAAETKDKPDASPGVSGRLCTVNAKGIGKLDLLVSYPNEPDEDGFVFQFYDPDNPRSYLKMQAQIDGILRSIRFSDGVKVLYTAPAYKEGAPVPETIHVHQWSSQWSKDETHHWHDCTAPGCPLRENGAKGGYAEHQGDWTVVTEPTDRTAGKRYRTCEICGYFQQEITPAKLPTEDMKRLDLGAGTVTLTGEEIDALLNSLRAIPDVVVNEMNLMGPLIGYYADLDGDGSRDMSLTLEYKQTGPDEAPNQVVAVRCEALPEHSMAAFSGGVPEGRVDACLEKGLPVYGGVEICLSPEKTQETAAAPAN